MTDGLDNWPQGWLTVDEAAGAYRLSTRTVRRRLASGEIAGVKVSTPNGQTWAVQPPGNAQAPPAAATAPVTSTALIPIDQLEHLLAPLAAERDRLQAERDQARQYADQLHAARLEDARVAAEEIGRLRGLLEAQQAGQVNNTPPRRRWFWQR